MKKLIALALIGLSTFSCKKELIETTENNASFNFKKSTSIQPIVVTIEGKNVLKFRDMVEFDKYHTELTERIKTQSAKNENFDLIEFYNKEADILNWKDSYFNDKQDYEKQFELEGFSEKDISNLEKRNFLDSPYLEFVFNTENEIVVGENLFVLTGSNYGYSIPLDEKNAILESRNLDKLEDSEEQIEFRKKYPRISGIGALNYADGSGSSSTGYIVNGTPKTGCGEPVLSQYPTGWPTNTSVGQCPNQYRTSLWVDHLKIRRPYGFAGECTYEWAATTVVIDWGDNSSETVSFPYRPDWFLPASSHYLQHNYQPNGSGGPQSYTITITYIYTDYQGHSWAMATDINVGQNCIEVSDSWSTNPITGVQGTWAMTNKNYTRYVLGWSIVGATTFAWKKKLNGNWGRRRARISVEAWADYRYASTCGIAESKYEYDSHPNRRMINAEFAILHFSLLGGSSPRYRWNSNDIRSKHVILKHGDEWDNFRSIQLCN